MDAIAHFHLPPPILRFMNHPFIKTLRQDAVVSLSAQPEIIMMWSSCNYWVTRSSSSPPAGGRAACGRLQCLHISVYSHKKLAASIQIN
jgi:hypothetical protein